MINVGIFAGFICHHFLLFLFSHVILTLLCSAQTSLKPSLPVTQVRHAHTHFIIVSVFNRKLQIPKNTHISFLLNTDVRKVFSNLPCLIQLGRSEHSSRTQGSTLRSLTGCGTCLEPLMCGGNMIRSRSGPNQQV